MTHLRHALLSALLTLAAGVANAAPVHDYRFSFTGTVRDGSPEVVGIVRGLAEGDNAVDTVEIVSNSRGYGIGTYTHNNIFSAPNWTVTGGMVTAWSFGSTGRLSSEPDVLDSSLFLLNDASGFTNDERSVNIHQSFASFEKIAPIPLPAPIALLAAALLATGAVGARRKRAA